MTSVSRRGLFGRKSDPAGPRGHRAYAIGDVHGRLDLLNNLLARIEEDVAAKPARKVTIVFLGDLIDRGPSSAEVVERLRTYAPNGAKTVFLMGNHEEVMLRAIGGEAAIVPSWLRFGGIETLASYGLDARTLKTCGEAEQVAAIAGAVPQSHVRFLESFADSVSFGDYLFVHAGIRPGVDLSQQSRTDLRWIRDPFLGDESERDFIVVHGHTISPEVEVTPNRIGIDTGAFHTGVLTALSIEGSDRWFIQTEGGNVRNERLFPA